MSVCRSNFDVCVLGGKLFAVGGNDGRHSLQSVEAFDPGGLSISLVLNLLKFKLAITQYSKQHYNTKR